MVQIEELKRLGNYNSKKYNFREIEGIIDTNNKREKNK